MSIPKYLPKLVSQDRTLAKLFGRHGDLQFKPKLERSPYETLCRTIAHQQLHGKAAETILGRLIGHYNGTFPTPQELLDLPFEKLRGFGYSNNKCKALKDIAKHTLEGFVPTTEEIQKLSDDEIVERLVPIYGIGRWTVEMLLISQLGRWDVWPVDDFGVRAGYRQFRKLKEMPTAKEMRSFGDNWKPYRTVVALYLWREADLAKVTAAAGKAKAKPQKPAKAPKSAKKAGSAKIKKPVRKPASSKKHK